MLTYSDFIEIAKIVEVHIQKKKLYTECIGLGYFSERFSDAYKKYLKQIKECKE